MKVAFFLIMWHLRLQIPKIWGIVTNNIVRAHVYSFGLSILRSSSPEAKVSLAADVVPDSTNSIVFRNSLFAYEIPKNP